MANKGGCSFVTKIKNIQESGASIAIIIDQLYENIHSIEMTNDGFGNNIKIPSIIISRSDGDKLIKYITQTATDEELS